MKDKIVQHIHEPEVLEELYRKDKNEFTRSFNEIADNYDTELVHIWKIRLSYGKKTERKDFHLSELYIVIALALLTGLLIKLPDFIDSIKSDIFFFRNMTAIVFNGMILYMLYVHKIRNLRVWISYSLIIAALVVYANLLPPPGYNDSIAMIHIHNGLLLWVLFGLSFMALDYKNLERRMEYIRFNGEFIIMGGLLLLAGGILVGLSLGLFQAIGINLSQFYVHYVIVFGLAAIPVGTLYLIRIHPDLTNKIAPVIAKVFMPFVLVSLMMYLGSLLFSTSSLTKDRDALIMFNGMLLGVMAIIIFSISELDKEKSRDWNVLALFALAVLAIIADGIALYAMGTRILQGITPNRVVVILSNALIFIHLIFIAKSLLECYLQKKSPEIIDHAVARFMPVYLIYALFVIFLLPAFFGYH
ncbi:MAG: hypothetical protein PHI48_11420 [Bacteroidales bacterium]|nr:hypothetical protein [Bacteroidales bacterium]